VVEAAVVELLHLVEPVDPEAVLEGIIPPVETEFPDREIMGVQEQPVIIPVVEAAVQIRLVQQEHRVRVEMAEMAIRLQFPDRLLFTVVEVVEG
jgi:hypothetical protein